MRSQRDFGVPSYQAQGRVSMISGGCSVTHCKRARSVKADRTPRTTRRSLKLSCIGLHAAILRGGASSAGPGPPCRYPPRRRIIRGTGPSMPLSAAAAHHPRDGLHVVLGVSRRIGSTRMPPCEPLRTSLVGESVTRRASDVSNHEGPSWNSRFNNGFCRQM